MDDLLLRPGDIPFTGLFLKTLIYKVQLELAIRSLWLVIKN